MNLYACGLNNPLAYTDPTGLDALSKTATTSDVVGIAAGASDEISLVAYLNGANPSSALNTGANVAGKVTAGISMAIKTYATRNRAETRYVGHPAMPWLAHRRSSSRTLSVDRGFRRPAQASNAPTAQSAVVVGSGTTTTVPDIPPALPSPLSNPNGRL